MSEYKLIDERKVNENAVKKLCERCQHKEFCFLKESKKLAGECIKNQITEKTKEKEKAVKNAVERYNKSKKLYHTGADERKERRKEYKKAKKEYEIYISGTAWIFEN